MAVTVEELQILFVADVKSAMGQIKELQKNINRTTADIMKPMRTANESIKKASQQSAEAVARANARIAEANAKVQIAQDKMRASAAKTQAAIDRAAATSTRAQEAVRKSTEAASTAMKRQNEVLEAQRAAAERAREGRAKLADIIARATTVSAPQMTDTGPLYPPRKWTNMYANQKPAAQPQQPRAPDLSIWQRVTAQINAKLDFLKQKLYSVGLYGKEAGDKTAKALGKVQAPATRAAKAVDRVGQSTQRATRSGFNFSRMLSRLLIYRGLYGILRSIREGMQNMAQGNQAANATLSSLASSFLYLKNSVAAAFMPALQALLPVITAVTNALASLMNMIGAVTARLFGGSSTFVKAKKVQVDYAASLGKTGAAAKKAGEDAKGALASFDELNVIGNQDGGADAGGGGAAGANPADMFETVEIPAGAMAFADRVAEIFGKLQTAAQPTIEALGRLKVALEPLKTFAFTALMDFYSGFLVPVGSWVLGEGLPRFIDAISNGLALVNWQVINDALKTLWEALTPFAINVGEGLLWLWEKVLVPFGTWTMNNVVPLFLEILAAGIKVFNSVLEALKPLGQWLWDSFLQSLAKWTGGVIVKILESVRDALKKIGEWVDENQGVVETMAIIVGSFAAAWGLVNAAIAIWNVVGAIAAGVTYALSTAVVFLTSSIGIAVIAIGSIIAIGVLLMRNWDSVKETAANVWSAVKDFFAVKIPAAFQVVIDFVKNNWKELLLLITNPIAGAIALLYNLNPEFRAWVDSVLKAIKDKFLGMVDIGRNLVEGLWNGVWSKVEWIKTKVAGFVDTIKGLFTGKSGFDTHSPSKWAESIGAFVTGGFANGILKMKEIAVSAAEEVVGATKKVFDGIEYDLSIDYAALINAAEAAGDYQKAAQLEKQRNAKIDGEGLSYEKTSRYTERIADSTEIAATLASASLAEQQQTNLYQASSAEQFTEHMQKIFEILNSHSDWMKRFQALLASQFASMRAQVDGAWRDISRKMDILTAAVREIRINIVNNYYSSSTSGTPRLASGGVLTAETAFIGGEYAGASSNPEIVAPQSLMRETFLDAVWPLVDAMLEGTGNVTKAIEDKDTNVLVDGVALGRSMQKPMQRVAKQRGGSLVVG